MEKLSINFPKLNFYLFCLLSILVLSSILNFWKLNTLMDLFGDVGWFYISARDMILTHHIPLVGITSSHIWLHQGALWTYLLGVILALFKWNPTVPAYFIAFMGVLTVLVVYLLAKKLFDKPVALISAFFYSTSPLIIHNSRLPYHTSLIPFFTAIFIYLVYRWVKENEIRVVPFIALLIGILYNLEISTFSITITTVLILLYGLFKKKKYALLILNRKTLIYSLVLFLIPMTPMIIYDIHHGYPQTVKFVIWLFYKAAVLLGYPSIHPNSQTETWHTFTVFLLSSLKDFVYSKSQVVSVLVLGISYLSLLILLFKQWKKKKINIPLILIFLYSTIPALAYVGAKTNSSAYFQIFFPQTAIMIGVACFNVWKNKLVCIFALLTLIAIGLSNSYYLIKNDFYQELGIKYRLNNARQIISIAGGRQYNIIMKGKGSQYESFVTPYKYLTWYLGHAPSTKNEKLKFYVSENAGKIKMEIRQ